MWELRQLGTRRLRGEPLRKGSSPQPIHLLTTRTAVLQRSNALPVSERGHSLSSIGGGVGGSPFRPASLAGSSPVGVVKSEPLSGLQAPAPDPLPVSCTQRSGWLRIPKPGSGLSLAPHPWSVTLGKLASPCLLFLKWGSSGLF